MIAAIVRRIECYGVKVQLRPPASGPDDLGRICNSLLEVAEDPDEPTITAFTLCHLFGHLVQFTTRERYEHLIGPVAGTPPILLSDAFWRNFYAYEREAFGYGASILESALEATPILRSCYANSLESDFEHFRRYITTGDQASREEYRRKLQQRYIASPDADCIAPIPVPNLSLGRITGVRAAIH